MRRPAITLVATVVACAALAAFRSRGDTPPPLAKRIAEPTESASRPALDETSWYASSRSPTATPNRSRSTRGASGAVSVDESTDAPETPGTSVAPGERRSRVAPTSPARAPRTSGTPDEFLSDALFRRLDEDGDGVLRGYEIPTALRAALGPKAALTPEAFAPLFVATVQGLRAERIAAETPAWFSALDPENEGRVSLPHWRDAGRAVAEFRRIDTDGDGFVSRSEAVAFVAQPPAPTSAAVAPPGLLPVPGAQAPATASGTSGARPGATVATSDEKPQSKADALFDHYATTAATQSATQARGSAVTAVGAIKKPTAQVVSAPPTPPAPPAPPKPKPKPAPRATLPEPLTGNPYWVQRDNENLAMLRTGAKPDVLFLGDSITDGLGRGSGKPLWDELYAPLTALNFGIGGITTSHVLWQVETGQVALAAPKTIVLLIGSNNLGGGQKPGDVAAGVEKIVAEIGAQLPKTKILVLGILPRGFLATDPFRVAIPETNRVMADVEDGDRVTFLDIGSAFLAADNSISPDVMPDGAHPSLYGYQLYTLAIWDTLARLMPKK